jgi:predicted metal-dependent peptidase
MAKPVVDPYTAVLMRATSTWPYLSKPLLAMQPIERTDDPESTMSIDRHGRVYYNRDRIELGGRTSRSPAGFVRWNVKQAASVLLHELKHWLYRHADRSDPFLLRDGIEAHKLINLCEDAEINAEQREDKASELPDGLIYPERYGWPAGPLWEEHYAMARDQLSRGSKGSQELLQDLEQFSDCGSGAHGAEQPWEHGPAGSRSADGNVAPYSMGQAEAEALRREAAQDIVNALRNGNPGNIPLGMQRWAKAQLRPPTIPWQRELAALVHGALQMARGCVDYSYALPSRRGDFCGVIMPAMVRPEPKAAVVLDTSGSMDEATDIPEALSEIQGIIRACGQHQITVYCCDAAVGSVQRVANVEQLRITGGGGTDMGVGLERASQDGHRVVIVLTDGATPWPKAAPRSTQVVVAIVGARESRASTRQAVPAWVKRVVEVTRASESEVEAA